MSRADKTPTAQPSSTDLEGLAAQENKEEGSVVESPEGFGIRNIFTEMQLLAETGPGSELTQVLQLLSAVLPLSCHQKLP